MPRMCYLVRTGIGRSTGTAGPSNVILDVVQRVGIGHPYDAYPWTKENVKIYNVRGERVATGGYIYPLTGGGETLTQKMALVV